MPVGTRVPLQYVATWVLPMGVLYANCVCVTVHVSVELLDGAVLELLGAVIVMAGHETALSWQLPLAVILA